MAEIRFPDTGGTKDAFYTLNCSNVTPTFKVSSDATSWLFIDRHEPSSNKLVLSANTNVSVTATPERTGYIIPTVNGHTCDQKKLTVKQDAGGGGGSCQCTDVIYSDESFTWDGTTGRNKTLELSLRQGITTCPVQDLNYSFKLSSNHFSGVVTSDYTLSVGLSGSSPSESQQFNDILVVSFNIGQASEKIPCTKEIPLSWTSGPTSTCDCNGVVYSKESLHWDSGTNPQEVIITPPAGCEISDLGWEWLESGECFLAEKEGTNKLKVTPIASVTCADKLNISFKLNNNTICNDKEIRVTFGQSTNRAAIAWEDDTQLLPQGEVRRRAATFTSDDPLFDVNELSINTPDWITAEVEETEPRKGYVYLTYGYTPVSRMATVGATYRRVQAEGEDGGQTDLNQNGELYQDGLYFKITNNTLEPCGGSEYKIGEYCFDVLKPKDNPSDPDEYYFNYVENTSFTCTTKPDWVSHVTFGIPDTNTRKGNIYATYSRNPSSTESRTWDNITITYSGYQDVNPVGNTTMTQGAVTASVGACGESVNPGTAPTTCSEANFYHWDNPYAPGDLSYYYLEHDVSAYEQTYVLRTAADFNEYITRENGTKIPISTISNSMWEDVRVEIWDVVPDIVHNSACGLHHVEVQPGDSFATIKKRHTSGNSQSTCACPCYFNGWNPNNGAYEIYGYKSEESKCIALFEDGYQISADTSYEDFWLKAKYDGRNEYNQELDCREIQFVAFST